MFVTKRSEDKDTRLDLDLPDKIERTERMEAKKIRSEDNCSKCVDGLIGDPGLVNKVCSTCKGTGKK